MVGTWFGRVGVWVHEVMCEIVCAAITTQHLSVAQCTRDVVDMERATSEMLDLDV
jgi:hypothetical protein